MKKKIIPMVILAVLLLTGFTAWYYRPIGTVEGPEWDILHVDGVTYISESSAGVDIPYDRSDRGRHLGVIKSGEHLFHIYAVKGDKERNYLCWAWEWEGEMYIREELAASSEQTETGGQPMNSWKELTSLLAAHGLSGYDEKIEAAVKSSIHIEPEAADDESIAVGASKMGGLPDLPKGVDWFRQEQTDIPLTFICQINFAELKPCDIEDKLPASGILYFFYDCSMDGMPWGFDPRDAGGKAVYYYDGDLSGLERRSAPEDIDENGCVFGAARLRFETAFDLPDLESPAGQALALPDEDREKYWGLMDELSGTLINKLLGHSNNIQGGMELECELVTNGLYCGDPSGYQEGRARGLDKNTGHWNLLLQVDSNEELGMMWGDCGRLYLWITEEDLTARNFENSWLILQCG